jgi:hypothetical protein
VISAARRVDSCALSILADGNVAQELKDVPKRVIEVIEKLLGQGKTDAQILNNYQMQEFVEGNDVCPKGLENPEEKISRVRKVCCAAVTPQYIYIYSYTHTHTHTYIHVTRGTGSVSRGAQGQ